MRLKLILLAVAVLSLWCSAARAQFNAATGNSFDPEISTVNSGVLLDAQAVVSADRKYVTLNMRAQNASLVALRDFTFQTGTATGMVGSTPATPAAAAGNNANPANARAAPAGAAPPPARRTILDRPGMTRIDRR